MKLFSIQSLNYTLDKVINIRYSLNMNDKKHIESIANTLISQYGDDAITVAMLRAAEFAAELNKEEWMKWEGIIEVIKNIDQSPKLDG